MPLSVKGDIINEAKFCFPWRMILSGSSESGKTRFARDLLQRQDLFSDKVTSIVYHYPCFIDETPVGWHNEIGIPVSYKIGLPTQDELVNLPPNTCVILDDLYDEAIKSDAIDHLFRVISGKKKICVMIMTQNNFTSGKYGRDIRNSCNFAVLFRNCCDSNINLRVTTMAGLRKAYLAATTNEQACMYPYLFIDQSQRGQLSRYRLYTDIFGKFKTAWSVAGMKGYVIDESDFLSVYAAIEKGKTFEAVHKYVNKKQGNDQKRLQLKEMEVTDSSESTSSEEEQDIKYAKLSESDDTETEQHNYFACKEKQSGSESRKQTAREKIRSGYRQRFRDSIYKNKKRPQL